MGKTYSIDLRERIVSGIDGGLSCRAAAVSFAVSPSFAVKLKAYWAATGSVAPVRQGRPPGSGKLAPHLDFLVACVEERPDITARASGTSRRRARRAGASVLTVAGALRGGLIL